MENRNIQDRSGGMCQLCVRTDGPGVLGRNPQRPELKHAEDLRFGSHLSVMFRIFSKRLFGFFFKLHLWR